MDPKQTLREAYLFVCEARRCSGRERADAIEEALDRLTSYAGWRSMGGFEPRKGDVKARELWAMLDDLRESEGE